MITETIFNGKSVTIPMAGVQHFEKRFNEEDKLDEICIITDKTKWNFENDTWENAIYISNYNNEADRFIQAYCTYIAEKDGLVVLD